MGRPSVMHRASPSIWGWLARRLAAKLWAMKAHPGKPELHHGPYAAVEIKSGAMHCAAVGSLLGQVKLVNEAPLLPVRECQLRDVCRCHYRKLAERRSGSQDRRGSRRDGGGIASDRRASVSKRRESGLATQP